MNRNVILTGFMGTGKSTVGRELALLLDYRLVDTDQVITRRHGPIPEIFAREGEAGFRRHERETALELAARDQQVISTGGRLMLDPVNANVLEASGTVFCLVASADEIVRRVLADTDGPDRPLLAGSDPETRVRRLLSERAPLYARFTAVHTEGREPAEIAADLARRVAAEAPPTPGSAPG